MLLNMLVIQSLLVMQTTLFLVLSADTISSQNGAFPFLFGTSTSPVEITASYTEYENNDLNTYLGGTAQKPELFGSNTGQTMGAWMAKYAVRLNSELLWYRYFQKNTDLAEVVAIEVGSKVQAVVQDWYPHELSVYVILDKDTGVTISQYIIRQGSAAADLLIEPNKAQSYQDHSLFLPFSLNTEYGFIILTDSPTWLSQIAWNDCTSSPNKNQKQCWATCVYNQGSITFLAAKTKNNGDTKMLIHAFQGGQTIWSYYHVSSTVKHFSHMLISQNQLFAVNSLTSASPSRVNLFVFRSFSAADTVTVSQYILSESLHGVLSMDLFAVKNLWVMCEKKDAATSVHSFHIFKVITDDPLTFQDYKAQMVYTPQFEFQVIGAKFYMDYQSRNILIGTSRGFSAGGLAVSKRYPVGQMMSMDGITYNNDAQMSPALEVSPDRVAQTLTSGIRSPSDSNFLAGSDTLTELNLEIDPNIDAVSCNCSSSTSLADANLHFDQGVASLTETCSASLSMAQTPDITEQYVSSKSYIPVANANYFFSNSDFHYCGELYCKVFADDCATELQSQSVKINNVTYPFYMEVRKSDSPISMCVYCYNLHQVITFSKYIVKTCNVVRLSDYQTWFEVPYADSPSFTTVLNHTMFFSLSGHCSFDKCVLLEGIAELPAGGWYKVTQSGSDPFNLEIQQTIPAGHSKNLTMQCHIGDSSFESNHVITVKQIQDCSGTLSLNPGVVKDFEFKHSSNSSEKYDLGNATTYFSSTSEDCKVNSCKLMQTGCSSDYTDTEIAISNSYPFDLTAKRDSSPGYTLSFCLQCENLQQSIQLDNINVQQFKDCTNDMTLITDPSPTLDYEIDFADNVALVQVVDHTAFFSYTTAQCPVNCTLYESTCTTVYSQTNLSLSLDGAIMGKQNNASGWTESICLKCQTETGSVLSSSAITVLQKIDCTQIQIPQTEPLQFSATTGFETVASLTDIFNLSYSYCPAPTLYIAFTVGSSSLHPQMKIIQVDGIWVLQVDSNEPLGANLTANIFAITSGPITRYNGFKLYQLPDCSLVSIPFKSGLQSFFSFDFVDEAPNDYETKTSSLELFEIPSICNFTSAGLYEMMHFGCNTPYTGDKVTISDSFPFTISAKVNYHPGYLQSVRVCFTVGSQTKVVQLGFKQQRSCYNTLQPVNTQELVFPQNPSPSLVQVGSQVTTWFSIEDKEICPVTSCQLFEKDCMTPPAISQMGLASSFRLKIRLDKIPGQLWSVCVRCLNKHENVTSNVQQIRQAAPCPTCLSRWSQWSNDSHSFTIAFDDSLDYLEYKDPSYYFFNSNPEQCTMLCKFQNEACAQDYAGDKFKIDSITGKIMLKQSVPAGYTETACLYCYNSGGGETTKLIQVKQRMDCRVGLTDKMFPDQVLQYSAEFPEVTIGSLSDFFQFTDDCPLTTCSLTGVSLGDLIVLDFPGPPMQVTAQRTVGVGYIKQASLVCGNGLATATTNFQVTQIMDCRLNLNLNPAQLPPLSFNYVDQEAPSTLAQIKTYFLADPNLTDCPLLGCKVENEELLEHISSSDVLMGADNDLMGMVNVQQGFTVDVTLVCWNSAKTLKKSVTVEQQPDPLWQPPTPTPDSESTPDTDQKPDPNQKLDPDSQPDSKSTQQQASSSLISKVSSQSLQVDDSDSTIILQVSLDWLKQNRDHLQSASFTSSLGGVDLQFSDGIAKTTNQQGLLSFRESSSLLEIKFNSVRHKQSYAGRNFITVDAFAKDGVKFSFVIMIIIGNDQGVGAAAGDGQGEEANTTFSDDGGENDLEGQNNQSSANDTTEQGEGNSTQEEASRDEVSAAIEGGVDVSAEGSLSEAHSVDFSHIDVEKVDAEINALSFQISMLEFRKNSLSDEERGILEALLAKRSEKKAEGSGLVWTDYGYMYPDVNITELEVSRYRLDQDFLDTLPEPEFELKPLNTFAEIILEFNQEMITPRVLQQFYYRYAFEIQIMSSQDGSVTYGQFNKDVSGSFQRQLREQKEKKPNLEFSFFVKEHSGRNLVLQMDFENPKDVSEIMPENMFIRMVEPSMFKSMHTFKPVEPEVTNIVYWKQIPQLILDKRLGRQIQNTTRQADQAYGVATQSNYGVNLILKSSMQQLWGLIRALQIIVYTDLVDLPKPPHLTLFFNGCVTFASTDILDGETLLYQSWPFRDSLPLGLRFEHFDYSTKVFIRNSGSFFLIQAFFFVYILSMCMIHRVAVFLSGFRTCRKIGILTHQKSYSNQLFWISQKLVMETFLDLLLALLIASIEYKKQFWNLDLNAFDYGDFVMACLIFLILVSFLCHVIYSITSNYETIKNGVVGWSYEQYLEDVHSKTRMSSLFIFFMLLRRICMALTLVYLRFLPFFQLMILLNLSLAFWAYLAHFMPMKERYSHRISLYDEFFIFIIQELNFLLLDNSVSDYIRSLISWAIIGLASFNIFTHFVIIFQETSMRVYTEIRRCWYRRKRMKRFKATLSTERSKLKTNSEDNKRVQAFLNHYDALESARDWWGERSWLIANQIDVTKFKEEGDFKLIYDHYLKKRVQEYKQMKSMELAVEKTVEAKSKATFQKRVSYAQQKIIAPLETIKEETEHFETVIKPEKDQNSKLNQILTHNFQEQDETHLYRFDLRASPRRSSLKPVNQYLISSFQNEFSMDFLIEEGSIEEAAKNLEQPVSAKSMRFAYSKMAKDVSISSTVCEPLLNCLVETTWLAYYIFELNQDEKDKPLCSFLNRMYTQIYQNSICSRPSKIDSVILDKIIFGDKSALDLKTDSPLNQFESLMQVLFKELEASTVADDLLALDYSQIESCENLHVKETMGRYPAGFDLDNLNTILSDIKDTMVDTNYKLQKRYCEECKEPLITRVRRIRKYPKLLILKVKEVDPSANFSFVCELDLKDLRDKTLTWKYKKLYSLRAFILERVSAEEDSGEKSYAAVVRKKLQNKQTTSQFMLFEDGQQQPYPEFEKCNEKFKSIQPCLAFFEYVESQKEMDAEEPENEGALPKQLPELQRQTSQI